MILGLMILLKISDSQNLIKFKHWKLSLCFLASLITMFVGEYNVMGLHIWQYSVAKEILLTVCWDLSAYHFHVVLVN